MVSRPAGGVSHPLRGLCSDLLRGRLLDFSLWQGALRLGGHNSLFTAVFDERLKAVVPIGCCSSSSLGEPGGVSPMARNKTAPDQFGPGLFQFVDIHRVTGLIGWSVF